MKTPIDSKFDYIPSILTVFRGYGDSYSTFNWTWGEYMLSLDHDTETFVFTDHQNKYSVMINRFETVFLYGFTQDNLKNFNSFLENAAKRY